MGVSINVTKNDVIIYNFRNSMKGIIPRMDYHTHAIHPYTAKLIPHIPHYFIKKYTQRDDIIFDPFCGSGTTLLEAKHLNRNALGIDINPLATLISEVKTTPLDLNELKLGIRLIKEEVSNNNKKATVNFPNIDYWFSKKVQNELSKIKFCIENVNGKLKENIYKFLLVCYSSIIRKSSYADPRISKTYKSKRIKEKIKNGWTPTPTKYFKNALDKNFERIKSLSENMRDCNNFVRVFQGDARETPFILKQNEIKDVDFIITSPPYINAQDYFRSYKLELWWLGLATPEEVRILSKQAIGTEKISVGNYNSPPRSEYRFLDKILNKVSKKNEKKSFIVYHYFENMKCILEGFYNDLKTNSYFCLITGSNTICNVQIPTYKVLIHIAEDIGFELVELGRDEIRNRSLPPDRNHTGGVIKEEWITVFQKGG